MVIAWARVMLPSGSKWVDVTPLVMPLEAATAT